MILIVIAKPIRSKAQHETLLRKNPIVMNNKMLGAVSAIAILAAGAAIADAAHDLMAHTDGASEHANRLAETRLL